MSNIAQTSFSTDDTFGVVLSQRGFPMSYVWSDFLMRNSGCQRPTCNICKNPLLPEAATTDEYGHAVHRQCQALKMSVTQATIRPASKVVKLPGFLGHYTI
jgi:hypothetical protein